MTTAASLFEVAQIEAAQAALDGHTARMGLEDGNGPGTDLFHLLGSLLTWADAWSVDFDEILSQVREPVNVTATVTRFEPATYGAPELGTLVLDESALAAYGDTPDARREVIAAALLAKDYAEPAASREEAETEAMADYAAVVGSVVHVTNITGYYDETGQEDLRPHEGAPPFAVIVQPAPRGDIIYWNDEHLDARWNVEPAPGETRLYGLRSLWVFGRSFVVEG